jgi:DinB superfamily
MESTFKIWETNRKIHLSILERHSLEQLNTIPEGFNNNLIWNFGHIAAVQQSLIYRASGLPMNITDEFLGKFKSGTKPTAPQTQEEVDQIKQLLESQIEATKEDFANGIFVNYHEFTTSTGFNIASIEDAIVFNNYHEGLHLGYILSIRKLV